mgnify:CR=1 FL=1|jgi:hypothetical protein
MLNGMQKGRSKKGVERKNRSTRDADTRAKLGDGGSPKSNAGSGKSKGDPFSKYKSGI